MAFIIPTDLVFFFNLVIEKVNNLIFEFKKTCVFFFLTRASI